MDVALSKHDQVLLTGHSRVGRVQLPTCIACDRPLVDKVRARDMNQANRAGKQVRLTNMQGFRGQNNARRNVAPYGDESYEDSMAMERTTARPHGRRLSQRREAPSQS